MDIIEIKKRSIFPIVWGREADLPLSALYIRPDSSIIPKEARNDNWRDIDDTEYGFAIKSSKRAVNKDVSAPASRMKKLEESMQIYIIPALQTDGEKPVKAMKKMIRGIPKTESLRLLLTNTLNADITKAICIPETATMCASPDD